MTDGRTVFADGLMDASVAHGVARLTLAQTGGDGKPHAVGQLVMPLVQMPAFVNALTGLLKQIEAKAREAQASAGARTTAEPAAPQPEPQAAPSNGGVPGAFRFNN